MTKKILITLLVLAAGISAVSAKFPAPAGERALDRDASTRSPKTDDIDIAGKWSLLVQVPGQQLDVTLELKQEDKTFSGTMSSVMGEGKIVNGSIKDKEFSAVIQANIQGQDMEIQMSGKIDGEKMNGTLVVPNMDAIPFEGAKAK